MIIKLLDNFKYLWTAQTIEDAEQKTEFYYYGKYI